MSEAGSLVRLEGIAAVAIGLRHDEAHRAFQLQADHHVGERGEVAQVLGLAEERGAVLVGIVRLVVCLAGIAVCVSVIRGRVQLVDQGKARVGW